MKQIRCGVFETNSSSTHSVSIKHDHSLPVSEDGYVHVSMGRFGWEIKTYKDPIDKLSYLLTMLYMKHDDIRLVGWEENAEKMREIVKKLSDTEDFKQISDVVASHANCKGIILDPVNGYIDHQSHERYRSVQDFLDSYGLGIKQFVFDSGVAVHTDNDNH